MQFDEFWPALVALNKWQPDQEIYTSVEKLRAIAEQSYQQGVRAAKENPIADLGISVRSEWILPKRSFAAR